MLEQLQEALERAAPGLRLPDLARYVDYLAHVGAVRITSAGIEDLKEPIHDDLGMRIVPAGTVFAIRWEDAAGRSRRTVRPLN